MNHKNQSSWLSGFNYFLSPRFVFLTEKMKVISWINKLNLNGHMDSVHFKPPLDKLWVLSATDFWPKTHCRKKIN